MTAEDLDPARLNPVREPTPLCQLDRTWIEQRLANTEPALAEQFWFSESGCRWGNWYGVGALRGDEVMALAEEIARHHAGVHLQDRSPYVRLGCQIAFDRERQDNSSPPVCGD